MYIVTVKIYVASTTQMCEYRSKMKQGCKTLNKSHVYIYFQQGCEWSGVEKTAFFQLLS